MRNAEMSIHARMTTMSFPLGEGQTFHFVFSNKTQHDGLCLGVREDLVAVGVSVWQQQTNIPKDSVNWFNEWYPNAIRALKIVCFISAEYLRSPYCMKEFGIAAGKPQPVTVIGSIQRGKTNMT